MGNYVLALKEISGMLKYRLSARLLKKVQMQGGARRAGYPPQVGPGVLKGTPQRAPERTNAADGPFSAAC
jgi:hypothetical protein